MSEPIGWRTPNEVVPQAVNITVIHEDGVEWHERAGHRHLAAFQPSGTYPRVEVTGTEIVTTYVTDDGNICRAHDELTVGPGLSGFMLAGRLAERFKDNEPKARMTSAYVDARTIHHTMP